MHSLVMTLLVGAPLYSMPAAGNVVRYFAHVFDWRSGQRRGFTLRPDPVPSIRPDRAPHAVALREGLVRRSLRVLRSARADARPAARRCAAELHRAHAGPA